VSEEERHAHLLLWYVSGNLEPEQAALVEAHLRDCAECRIEAKALASMMNSLVRQGRTDHVSAQDLVSLEEGEVPEQSRRGRSVKAHLEDCAGCREDLRILGHARRASASLHEARPAPITAAQVASPSRARRKSALATACLVILVALGLALAFAPRRVPVGPDDAEPALFPPARRGVSDGRLLHGGGPWSITVVLPFDAPEGTYSVWIERDDLAIVRRAAPIASDGHGNLTVPIESLPGEGLYRMVLEKPSSRDGPPYIYPFQLASRAHPESGI